MNKDAENKVRGFYDGAGWDSDESGSSLDAQLWEDLRPAARDYVVACRKRILEHLPRQGDRILDAGCGPIQYPEYLEYSKGFKKRVCVDISQKALDQAKKKLGERGEYVCASLLELPLATSSVDAVVSMHAIYHIDKDQQEAAVRQLIRVAKPGAKIVIVYANPDRIFAMVKRVLRLKTDAPDANLLYYHAHPLTWWNHFTDQCKVRLVPWRSLTAQDSRRIFPDNALGSLLFRAALAFENLAPDLATRFGAYPVVVMTKN